MLGPSQLLPPAMPFRRPNATGPLPSFPLLPSVQILRIPALSIRLANGSVHVPIEYTERVEHQGDVPRQPRESKSHKRPRIRSTGRAHRRQNEAGASTDHPTIEHREAYITYGTSTTGLMDFGSSSEGRGSDPAHTSGDHWHTGKGGRLLAEANCQPAASSRRPVERCGGDDDDEAKAGQSERGPWSRQTTRNATADTTSSVARS